MGEDGAFPSLIPFPEVFSVRIRPFAALSAVALSAVLLAGCAAGAPESTATDADSDLCSAAAPEGDTAEAITVGSEVGTVPAPEFTTPLEVTSAERAVVVEGGGDPIQEGDYVSYAVAIFDGTTGETVNQGGFDGNPLPPMPITIGSGADSFFGCAPEGSRIVVTVPPSQGDSSQVYVLDVLDVTPAAEWCAPTEPGEVFPDVEFSDDGAPTITIPDADAPDGVVLDVIEEGDGDTVQSGDSVTVDYTGVKWSDGSVFDSSWERGEPATFSTTGVVAGFQRALEGQKVGSTVVVSMSPTCGYGEAGTSSHELAGETLVFVVEILATEEATTE